uniref:G-protein coupled receptors family 3 profile domain-containing protein n=1 Tax=Scleropages formosus TaxID=113540 RepID=A0A8C9SHB7_SCLFO
MTHLFYWILFYLDSVFVPGQTNPISASSCFLQGHFEPSFLANGHFMIGGLFPMHYRVEIKLYLILQCWCLFRFDPRAFRWAQAMRFAIEEINKNQNLLPNFTLGYKIYDSCATHVAAQRAVLGVLNGPEETQNAMCFAAAPLLAVIGDSGSSQSVVASNTLQPFRIPMISYFSTCSCLSDRKQYPTFFRVVPSDDFQVKAIAQLLQRFGWKWVGIVTEDDDYGRYALQGLLREFRNIGVCLAYYEMIPKVYDQKRIHEILRVMKQSTAKVVINFAGEGELYPLLKEYMDLNITGIQWIASEAWVTASVLASSYPFMVGTIGFAIRQGKVPGLKNYLLTVNPLRYPNHTMVQELWQHSGYLNTSNLRVTYNVYKAVYAIAHSLHNLINCEPGREPFQNSSCANTTNIYPWEVKFYTFLMLRLILYFLIDSCTPGSRKAVRRGEPLCCFDCVPCDDGKISNQTGVFRYTLSPSPLSRTECIPKAVEFLTHDAMGLTLTVISVVGACLTAAILLVFIRHRNTPIVRVNNSELSFFILLSLILCFLCALLFIGEPTVWSCMLRHTAFSITFSLCISCILGKTLVVLAAFTATRPGNNIMKWLGPKQQRVIIFACTLVQVLICSMWLIAAPPFPFKNTQYSRSKIILECSVGSDWAFWSVLGYIGLLACLCFVLAFLARKLPGNFNEAKYITFSILIFCAVWLAFIPAYVSSPGKFTVAVEIFAILASSFGLLLCLFAPKSYIILLKPQKNTKQHLMGKVIK